MKLGKLAIKRERAVLDYLKANGPKTSEEIQCDMIKHHSIYAPRVLADLAQTGYVDYANNLWTLSEKGYKYLRKNTPKMPPKGACCK